MAVVSICTQLTELGIADPLSTYYDHINRGASRRELRDGELKGASAASTPQLRCLRCPQSV